MNEIFVKDLSKIEQRFHKILITNIEHIMIIIKYLAKFYLTINDPLPEFNSTTNTILATFYYP